MSFSGQFKAIVKVGQAARDAAGHMDGIAKAASRFNDQQLAAFEKMSKIMFTYGGEIIKGEQLIQRLQDLIAARDELLDKGKLGDAMALKAQIDDFIRFINAQNPGANIYFPTGSTTGKGSKPGGSATASAKGGGAKVTTTIKVPLPGGGLTSSSPQGGITSGKSTGQLP